MHATVETWSSRDHATTVLTDAGRRLSCPPAAFDGSGLLRLHPGQRVRVVTAADGAVTALTLTTLPLPGAPS